MLRVRFEANFEDSRPVNWPVKYPFWESGFASDGSYAIIISFADDKEYIYRNWPEAKNLEIEEVERVTFSNRFSCPDWYKEFLQEKEK
jgi:hypothetical protein